MYRAPSLVTNKLTPFFDYLVALCVCHRATMMVVPSFCIIIPVMVKFSCYS